MLVYPIQLGVPVAGKNAVVFLFGKKGLVDGGVPFEDLLGDILKNIRRKTFFPL